jgi:choline-sulfatase
MYGGKAKTPNLDRLASTGAVFENFYCNYPLCGPSRSSMLTGKLATQIGMYDNAADFAVSEPTFAHFLRRAGYRTCLSGKMHFIGPDQLHGFEERLTTDIYPADFAWLPSWDTGDVKFESVRGTIENGGVCAWNLQLAFDEDATRRAIHKIYDLAREPENPFLLWVSLSHPHFPFLARPEHWELYADKDIPEPTVGRLPEAELDPHSVRCLKLLGLYHEDVNPVYSQRSRRGYYASISYFDEKLGQILDALASAGLGEETIIMVTADHGEMLGERGLWAKECFFEWSMRVPLLVKLPGQKSPQRVQQNASLIDLLPTFLDVASIDAGRLKDGLMGSSLLPMLSERRREKDEVLADYTAEATNQTVVMIRSGHLKYLAGEFDPEILYDLEKDPNELRNIAALPEYADQIAAFRRRVIEVWDFPKLREDVLSSQRRRMVVAEALKTGRRANWDFMPMPDYNEIYVRSHSHEVIDRRVRIAAPGYELPRNHMK